MGMFDDIKCDYPLPDDPPGIWFQTKSMDKQLEAYEIRRDGTLWALYRRSEPHRLRFTGIINFYGDQHNDYYDEKHEPQTDLVWYEYDARFRRGRLVALKVVGSVRQDEWREFMDKLRDRVLA